MAQSLKKLSPFNVTALVLGAAGALVVTGTVERENIGGWIKSLERAFDLQATEESDQIVLRTR